MEIPIKKNNGTQFVQKNTQRNTPFAVVDRKNNYQSVGGQRSASYDLHSPQREKEEGKKEDSFSMKIIEKLTKWSIYLTIFFLPLFFMPVVPSPLELNKQMLLVTFTGFGFLAWVGKMAWKNEIRFKKNFILVPVVTFLAIYGISAIFSVYTEQSLWGYFGGEGDAFVTVLFLVALFLLILNNIQTRKELINVIFVFLISGTLATVYALLQISEIFILPVSSTKNVYFNTVGSVYAFAVYAGALLLTALALFMENVSKLLKIILILASFLFFYVLMAINFKIVWFALMISIALLLGATIVKNGKEESQSRILPMIFLVLSLFMVLGKTSFVTKKMPVEVLLNYKTSAAIAGSTLKSEPLLGTGPTLYSVAYQLHRPSNLGSFWSVNFNNATSYLMTLFTTVGLLGGLSFIFLVGTGMVYLFKGLSKLLANNKQADFMIVGAGSVWLFVTIILLAYLANITVLMLWWFSFALFLSFLLFDPKLKGEEFVTSSQSSRTSLALSFVFVLLIIGFITAIYMQTQKYIAAIYFNKALVADAKGEPIDVVQAKVAKAIEIDPNRDLYYRNMSVALFAQANKRVAEKGREALTQDDSVYISNNIKGALQSADRAMSINPKEAANYVALANVYEGVLATMDQADQNAIKNYESAIQYDPYNPALHQKIAGIYVVLYDIEVAKSAQKSGGTAKQEISEESKNYIAMAKDQLNKALKIKKDYADANLLMTSIYEREGNLSQAIENEKNNKEMFSGVPGISFRLGVLYYKDNQLDQAKEEFLDAVVLDNNYSNARYFLGLIYDKQSDKKSAIEQFEKIAELNPDNADVKKILENLKSGKEALAGLLKTQNEQAPIDKQPDQPEQQPVPETSQEENYNINPGVERQEIPQQAIPNPEELLPPNPEANR